MLRHHSGAIGEPHKSEHTFDTGYSQPLALRLEKKVARVRFSADVDDGSACLRPSCAAFVKMFVKS